MDARSASDDVQGWSPWSCTCSSGGQAVHNATGIECISSALCGAEKRHDWEEWAGWPSRACLFTSLHMSPTGIRPWYRSPNVALRAEHRRWRRLLSSLSRVQATPRMYTLVREENVSVLWAYNTTAVPVHLSYPHWAYLWHRQSFAKLAVPRVARSLGCERALFLDNDCHALANFDHLFHIRPPAFVWHRGSGGRRLNSGVMLLPTDPDFVHGLDSFVARQFANRSTPKRLRDGSDQELLQSYFSESGRPVTELPARYNARKSMRLNLSDVVIAHLIRGDDDGDPSLKRADFVPQDVLAAMLPFEQRPSRLRT